MQKDDTTWLNIALIFFGLLSALVVWKAIGFTLVHYKIVDGSEIWFAPSAIALSGLIGGGISFFLQRDAERREFLLGAINELRRVNWPSWNDTRKMTGIVVVVVVIFACILSVFDFVWAKALRMLIS